MKQTLLSLSLLFGLAGGAAAQSPCAITLTKSGTGLSRTYTANLTGATGPVTYYLAAYANGYYSGYTSTSTLNVTYPGGGIYTITASGLSGSCGDSLVISDTVSGPLPSPTNHLDVSVYIDSTTSTPGFVPQVKTYLIKKDNTAGTLTAVDSVVTNMWGYICSCRTVASFNAIPDGTYRTKSYIMNQPAGATTGYLPTYSTSNASWSNADTFVFAGNTGYIHKNTVLLTGTPSSGPGFVGGLISAGANKGTAEGDPVKGITIFLRNAAGKVLQMVTTGPDGKFAFNNVATGTYTVYPEELNFTTFASDPVVVNTTQTKLAVNFKRNENAKQYVPGAVLGVGTVGTSSFSVTPNPATDKLQINLGSAAGTVTATLSNATGQVVLQEVITGTNATLSISQLPAGLYILQLQNGTEIHTEKVQIQH